MQPRQALKALSRTRFHLRNDKKPMEFCDVSSPLHISLLLTARWLEWLLNSPSWATIFELLVPSRTYGHATYFGSDSLSFTMFLISMGDPPVSGKQRWTGNPLQKEGIIPWVTVVGRGMTLTHIIWKLWTKMVKISEEDDKGTDRSITRTCTLFQCIFFTSARSTKERFH